MWRGVKAEAERHTASLRTAIGCSDLVTVPYASVTAANGLRLSRSVDAVLRHLAELVDRRLSREALSLAEQRPKFLPEATRCLTFISQ